MNKIILFKSEQLNLVLKESDLKEPFSACDFMFEYTDKVDNCTTSMYLTESELIKVHASIDSFLKNRV